MLFSRKTALWLAILPSTLAIDCTASNAIDLNSSGGSGGGGSGGSSSTCTDLCGNDLTCLGLCDGSAAAVGAIKGRNLNVRATLTCTTNETCVSAEGLLVCVDVDTGLFHDETGGSGNLLTGEYTEGNGVEETPASITSAADSTSVLPSTSAPPLPTTSDTETATKSESQSETETPVKGTPTTIASESDSETETPVNGTPTTIASDSNTSAAATPTSGVGRLSGRGAAVGALGLLIGILAN